jgi:hypothetical protein
VHVPLSSHRGEGPTGGSSFGSQPENTGSRHFVSYPVETLQTLRTSRNATHSLKQAHWGRDSTIDGRALWDAASLVDTRPEPSFGSGVA